MLLELAWRNIWRNRKRTAILLVAVVIGIWSMIFLGALMRGIADQMVTNGIDTLTGHVAVQERGYHEDPAIENRIADPGPVRAVLEKNLPPGSRWTARVRVPAVAATARHSTGLTLVGIDPETEKTVSFLGKAMHSGRYLEEGDTGGILVGEALLERMETRIGHRLVLMSQDTGGEIASRSFTIAGTFRGEMESTEKSFVFVNGKAAREMLKMGEAVSEFSVILPREGETEKVAALLRRKLAGEPLDVLTWKERLPLVSAVLSLYDQFIFLWYVVVFVAMGFGLVNTILMAVFERMREFGLLKALGMRPRGIVGEVLMEALVILGIGAAAGNVLGILSVLALKTRGIDLSSVAAGSEYAGLGRAIFPSLAGTDLLLANGVVFVLGAVVSLYPAFRAARFTPVRALAKT